MQRKNKKNFIYRNNRNNNSKSWNYKNKQIKLITMNPHNKQWNLLYQEKKGLKKQQK